MFGRIFFGCHWLADTIVGATIGIVIGYIVYGMGPYYCSNYTNISLIQPAFCQTPM